MPDHPFTRIPDGRIRVFAVPVAVVSMLLLAVMAALVQQGPGWWRFGELVLAFVPERAARALVTWSAEDRARIAFVNGLDYLFGPLYANLLALGCVWAGRLRTDRAHRASALAWLAWLVWVLDVPENVAYLHLVLGDVGRPWPQLSATCVLVRTAFVLAVLGFLARCVVERSRDRPARVR